MKISVDVEGIEAKNVKINPNGAIYGLKKYAGHNAVVIVLPLNNNNGGVNDQKWRK